MSFTESPLSAAELDVLRAQYEKEGDMVGVQTKFNYAWVSDAFLRLLFCDHINLGGFRGW